jgi:drug/metabolite transporter (DMT)-like permease
MSVPLAYLGVIIIWSTTPLAIKWSNETGSFLFGVTGRMALGALLCLMIIRLWKIKFPWDRRSIQGYLAISLAVYGAMLSTYWGAQFIPSGLISVLFGLTPLATSLLTLMLLKGTRLTVPKWIGMGLGLVGLAVIFQQDVQQGGKSIWGFVAIGIAVVLHASSTLWVKHLELKISPIALTTGGLVLAVPFYGITWIFLGSELPQHFPVRALLAIGYLGVFGSVVGFFSYYYVVQRVDAGKVALITLITPITALLLGQALNGETVSSHVWLGAAVVLSGLALYQYGELLCKSKLS